jgi:cytochrome c oxidase assembly protein subunit 15
VGIWLLVCCAMIFVMVVIGGLTRLTESGLSMVDWRPIMGTLPPLSEAEWQETFERYKASPEFRKLNFWMTLADFKGIFWFEYIHRVWGRAIGLVYFLPFAYFLLRRRVDRRLGIHLTIGLILGALQGVLGWIMVKSGLVERPDVSQYRLAAHLGSAIVIYGYLLWIALGLLAGERRMRDAIRLRFHAGIVATWSFFTAITGAFVAGLDAGRAYNTFPLMDGQVVPDAMFELDPWIINFFENAAAVQFTHRVAAILLVLTVLALWLRSPRPVGAWLAVAVIAQACLGVATLLTGVDLWLAATHQAGALVVFTLAIWTSFMCRKEA